MANNLNSRLLGWFASGSKNSSAKTLACAGSDLAIKLLTHPKDPRDFNSCLLLLRSVPELRDQLSTRVASLSQPWADLVAEWGDIEAMFLDEAGWDFSKNSSAPNTHALLKKILADDLTAAFTVPNDLRSQSQSLG